MFASKVCNSLQQNSDVAVGGGGGGSFPILQVAHNQVLYRLEEKTNSYSVCKWGKIPIIVR